MELVFKKKKKLQRTKNHRNEKKLRTGKHTFFVQEQSGKKKKQKYMTGRSVCTSYKVNLKNELVMTECCVTNALVDSQLI